MNNSKNCNSEINDVVVQPVCQNDISTQQEVHIDKSKNDLFAWIMALIPLVGGILGVIIGFGYTCLVLNILLGYIDEKSLKNQGVDTSAFGEWTFLVPYYLFKRAKVLNDGMGYFIVWCVLFVITLFL